MSRLACFADCHIGCYAAKLDPATGLNTRLLDTAASLRFVIHDAVRRDIRDFVFAGDMFRTAKPTPTEVMMVVDAVLPVGAIQMITGNHDIPRAAGESTALDYFGRLGDDVCTLPRLIERSDYQLGVLPYPNRAQLAAAIPEFAQMSPEEADQAITGHLTTILRDLAAELKPGLPSVLLAHISIDLAEPGAERGIMAGRDICVPLDEIPEEFSFCVLGHVHYAQDFAKYGRPKVFYTGSTDRIDFGEESQAKSYVILDTEAGTWERVPIPCRQYETVPVIYEDGEFRMDDDLSGCKDAICRAKVTRPEIAEPDYDFVRRMIEQAGAWDYRGVIEEVHRTAAIRSEEIAHAQTLPELLGVWFDAKRPACDLPALVEAASELERMVTQ